MYLALEYNKSTIFIKKQQKISKCGLSSYQNRQYKMSLNSIFNLATYQHQCLQIPMFFFYSIDNYKITGVSYK